MSTEEKSCPICGEDIHTEAKICVHCDSILEESKKETETDASSDKNIAIQNCPFCGEEIPFTEENCKFCDSKL